MKIIIASGIYPPDVGGPATYSQLIAKEFSKRGNEIIVICYSDREQRTENNEQFSVKRILRKHSKPIRYLLYFWNLLKIARDADIIYAQGPINSGFPAVLVGKILRKKTAVRLGGDYIWEKTLDEKPIKLTLCEYYSSGVFKKQGIIFKIFKWVLNSVDLIIFSTEFQRDIYLKYLGLKKDKTVIIKNAFPDLKETPQKFIRSNEILFAGRLTRAKNLDLLIDVFSEVLSVTNKDIQLRLTGDADEPEKRKLQELIKELNLEKRVIFENRISHQELLKRIQKCYFAVLPSLTEISPNFVLDCIKLNKPILCTQEIGFYRDFKNDLVFFNPYDKKDLLKKIKWLLKEENYKDYQKRMKRIKVERSWSELAKEHLLIFNKLK